MGQIEAPSAEFKITSANRQAVKDWLAAQGFDATRVQSMRDQTLLKAYTDPRYLRALTNRGDYNPSVERNGDAHDNRHSDRKTVSVEHNGAASIQRWEPCNRAGAMHHEESGTSTPAPGGAETVGETQPGENLNLMAEAGLDSAPAVPENTQGVTEARVIELIRALAVLKPGLDGLEDLL